MTGLFTFTGLLLVVKFVENISGERIRLGDGKTPYIHGPYFNDGRLQECTAEHNGVTYGIYPNTHPDFHYGGDDKKCAFVIHTPNFDHAGIWTINAIGILNQDTQDAESSKQTNYTLHIHENARVLPSNDIHGSDGSYATVYFANDFDTVTKCYISTTDYSNDTNYVMGNNGSGISADLEWYEKCTIRIPININWAGGWNLVQESSDYKTKSGTFYLKHVSIAQPAKFHEQWVLGRANGIETPLYEREYCELERPDGRVISFLESKCKYDVKKVSNRHSGVWKARYVPMSSMYTVENEIIVDVIDLHAINVTVTTTKDKMIHMLCRTHVNAIDHCLFRSPNGTIINLMPGVGSDKYAYFGTGFRSYSESNFAECGLTIRQPSSHDYGMWTCHIKVNANSNEVISAFVSTSNGAKRKIGHSAVITSNVYVKRGDNFAIKCTTDEALDYCWLRSPNGTNYSVTKSRTNSINSLPYVGEGLSVGVCGATIENADDTHTGDWSCRLGVVESAEIESIVPVTVTDSYLIPLRKRINIAYDVPTMTVRILPDVDASIQYCRWVSPNGHGLYKDDSPRYLRSQSNDSCTLHLNDWSIADIGTWHCYARLRTGSDEEIHTSIEFISEVQRASNMMLKIIIASVLTVTIIGAIIFTLIIRRKRMAVAKTPPSCFNEFDVSKHYPTVGNEKVNL